MFASSIGLSSQSFAQSLICLTQEKVWSYRNAEKKSNGAMFSLVRNVSVNSPENQHIAKASTTLEDFDIDARQVQSFQSPQLCDRFTHDAQVLANGGGKVWNLLFPIRVFTQHASKIKGFGSKFACKSASAFCLNWAIVYYHLNNDLECPQRQSKHVKFV